MNKKKIGIIGATGYTGSELVRILTHHPGAEIVVITSESRAGERFSDVHPFLQGIADQQLVTADRAGEFDPDLVFLALPHGVSMDFVRANHKKDFRIIDLSGDFRLSSPEVYEAWYNKKHNFEEGFETAVFGCPELFRNEIEQARLVANPGCYPTSAILGAAPLVRDGLVDAGSLIVDSKSGITGAGIKPKPTNLFSNVNDNFKAYGLKKHRHTIEIQEVLSQTANTDVTVQFTPHLLPVDRGILTTIYGQPVADMDQRYLESLYRDFYAEAPFVRMRPEPPTIKDVRGSNYCDIFVTLDERTQRIIVISVIDNLVKGAAGLAVQNMNLMFGFEETAGLEIIPVNP